MSGETRTSSQQETAEILTSFTVTTRKRPGGRPTIDKVMNPIDLLERGLEQGLEQDQDMDGIGMIEMHTECRVWRPTIDAVPRWSGPGQQSSTLH